MAYKRNKKYKNNTKMPKALKVILAIILVLLTLGLGISLLHDDVKLPDVGSNNNSSEVIENSSSSEVEEESSIESSEVEDSSEEEVSSSENEFVSAFHFTLVGSMNEWDIANDDYLFTTTDDITFYLNVDLAVGDEFKIANDNAWDWQYNINNVVESSKQYVDTSSTDNIKMITEGNYDIELNITDHVITLVKN